MAGRRDNKNRILQKGEYQKSDGRYMYRYSDANGKTRFVYSWTLTQTDRVPNGKARCKCLRELEQQISRDRHDGVDTATGNHITLDKAFDMFMQQHRNVSEHTRQTYHRYYTKYVSCVIGDKPIADVRYVDIKTLCNNVLYERRMLLNTLSLCMAVLRMVFKFAIKNKWIREDPTDGVLSEYKKDPSVTKKKPRALSRAEQASFLTFVEQSKYYNRWSNMFRVLLGTGMRIGEICALKWSDCDFDTNTIRIRNTVLVMYDESTKSYSPRLSRPKTENSIRDIPMFSFVREALLDERRKQSEYNLLNGIRNEFDLCFPSRNGRMRFNNNVNITIDKAIKSYNKEESKRAAMENRQAVLLPHFSAHTFRHTFCTRLVEDGLDVKVIQSVMGHSDITTTLNIYADATNEHNQSAFQEHDAKFFVV